MHLDRRHPESGGVVVANLVTVGAQGGLPRWYWFWLGDDAIIGVHMCINGQLSGPIAKRLPSRAASVT
jgi:hypothetical protein